jgi:hypothetical protein
MTFSPREVADGLYGAVIGMGMGRVHGADPDEVRAARIDLCDRAARAITQALDGPERRFVGEPDDVTLRRWQQQVQHRRDALQPATQ